jgi:hypothetical protein
LLWRTTQKIWIEGHETYGMALWLP